MTSAELDELIKQTDSLSPEERLQLLEHLRRGVSAPGKTNRKWREIRGVAQWPLLDEDAQAWVSRTRREGDEHRDSQVRRD